MTDNELLELTSKAYDGEVTIKSVDKWIVFTTPSGAKYHGQTLKECFQEYKEDLAAAWLRQVIKKNREIKKKKS